MSARRLSPTEAAPQGRWLALPPSCDLHLRPNTEEGADMRMYEFVGKVQNGAHLPSMEQAINATRATLATLAERLGANESRHLAEQLPEGIGQYLTARERGAE